MTIEREKAIEKLKLLRNNMGFTEVFEEALDMAIEAMSERTGEWIWSDEDMSWKCGNCGCVFEEIDWKPEYNFCPNCGSRMESEDK